MVSQIPNAVLQPYGRAGTPGDLQGLVLSRYTAYIKEITSTSYTLVPDDSGAVLSVNNSAQVTLIVPGTLPVGFNCLVYQANTGGVAFSFTSNAQNLSDTTALSTQYSYSSMLCVDNPGASAAKFIMTSLVATSQTGLPVNTVLPVISGSAINGQTLSVTSGTWTNSPTGYAYQWLANSVAIAGATATTYTLTASEVGKTISVSVTATNAAGSSGATAPAVGPVGSATSIPVNSVLPIISGTPAVGQTLTAGNGTWTNSPTSYTYQWKANGTNISAATSSTYLLTSSEAGKVITVTVTATNASGSASATSSATSSVTATVTWDPLNKGSNIVLTNSNLTVSNASAGASTQFARSTTSRSTGKYYVEMSVDNFTGGQTGPGLGACNASASVNALPGVDINGFVQTLGNNANFQGWWFNNVQQNNSLIATAIGQRLCMAFDIDNLKVWWRINNGNWNGNGSADPAAGTNGWSLSSLAAGPYYLVGYSNRNDATGTLKPTSGDWSYSAPSGFSAW